MKTIHKIYYAIATLFGIRVAHPGLQCCVCLLVFSAIYLAAVFISSIALQFAFVCLGLLGVLAINEVWSNNERTRLDIAKKLAPKELLATLPDLRLLALLSFLQLLFLFPLFFQRVQFLFHLYSTEQQTNIVTWIDFTLDGFCRAILDWAEIYDVHFSNVTANTAWGRHLVMFKRLMIDYLLLRGLFRLWDIHRTIRDSLRALLADPGVAALVGTRAVRPLIRVIRKNYYSEDARKAAEALGQIGDRRAVAPLLTMLQSLIKREHELYMPHRLSVREKHDIDESITSTLAALKHINDSQLVLSSVSILIAIRMSEAKLL